MEKTGNKLISRLSKPWKSLFAWKNFFIAVLFKKQSFKKISKKKYSPSNQNIQNISKNKRVLGVMGQYCSGKTTVSEIFRELGYEVIEVDSIGHEALRKKKEEVSEVFGTRIIQPSGEVDRRLLAEEVFSDGRKRKKLEAIVHPWMKKEVQNRIENTSSRKILLTAALLLSMQLAPLCEKVILVYAPKSKLIERARRRDGLSQSEIEKRIKSQLPFKIQKRHADIVLINDQNLGHLRKKTLQVLNSWNEGLDYGQSAKKTK